MAYVYITDSDLAVDKAVPYTRMRQFRDNDEACADNPFWFELAEQTETLGTYQVETEFNFRVPESGKVVKLFGQMKQVGGGTAYAKFRVKGQSDESDEQTETNSAYQDHTWTFSDLSAYAGQDITIELLMYQSGGTTAYTKADGNIRSYVGRS